jgi:DNA-binding response OmpR family regulator
VAKAVPSVAQAPARGGVTQGSGTGRTRGASDFGNSSFLGLGKPTPSKAAPANLDNILIVDDSDVALKFMQNRLTRYGFAAELARSGEEALSLVASGAYRFVFLDVMMDGLDGYQTCRAIKQRKYPEGSPPVVVMLTSRGGSIDKIRGSLAGCDAYLTKPLNEAELLKVLSSHDKQVKRSFAQTNVGVSAKSSFDSR